MSEFVLTFRGEVTNDLYDRNNHMNIVNYLFFFDQAATALFEKVGFTENFIREHSLSVVAGKILTTHKKEMFIGDHFEIKSGFIAYDQNGFVITNRMFREGVLVAVCDMTMYVIDLNSRKKALVPEVVLGQCFPYHIPGLKNHFIEV